MKTLTSVDKLTKTFVSQSQECVCRNSGYCRAGDWLDFTCDTSGSKSMAYIHKRQFSVLFSVTYLILNHLLIFPSSKWLFEDVWYQSGQRIPLRISIFIKINEMGSGHFLWSWGQMAQHRSCPCLLLPHSPKPQGVTVCTAHQEHRAVPGQYWPGECLLAAMKSMPESTFDHRILHPMG